MTSYLVPAAYGEAEYVEKRSRFIARVWPCETEAEALAHLEATRKQHYDARHNVYAYIIREGGIMRYSDDGEPQGTSGQPTLNVFRSQEIQNFCCVVTRYFGGILLGTGGLVRAYSTAAKMALENAGISRMALWKSIELGCSYSQFERIKRLLEEHEAVIENTDFGADIVFSALLREDKVDDFAKALTELTAGTVEYLECGESFRGVKIK
ncbi:MAG: YigZ family protein [Oscillospiraceae bacterium]|nr:YigZ family protein [Oscillospiraceae bacterium]